VITTLKRKDRRRQLQPLLVVISFVVVVEAAENTVMSNSHAYRLKFHDRLFVLFGHSELLSSMALMFPLVWIARNVADLGLPDDSTKRKKR